MLPSHKYATGPLTPGVAKVAGKFLDVGRQRGTGFAGQWKRALPCAPPPLKDVETLVRTRPLLVEVQALVNKTSYGYPKRAASGIDLNRVNLLVAMLERRTKLSLSEQDIYLNIVGGIRLQDPAADLAICLAIGSAAKGLQLKQNAVVFGEVGLSGEVRHVPFIEKRVAEAKKLGFEVAIGPKDRSARAPKNTLLHSVPDVRTALNEFLQK